MDQRIVFFDTETSGFSAKAGHRIIEIGAIEVINNIPTGREFHVYLDPERDIDKRAQEVHGISSEMLKGKPKFSEIADQFIEFVKGADLVAHNMGFDEGHVDNELALAGYGVTLQTLANSLIDSLDIAKEIFPGKKHNLDALCDKLGVDRTHRTSHGALLDAKILSEVTARMLEKRAQIQQIKSSAGNVAPQVSIQSYASVRFFAPDERQMEHDAFLARIGARQSSPEPTSSPKI